MREILYFHDFSCFSFLFVVIAGIFVSSVICLLYLILVSGRYSFVTEFCCLEHFNINFVRGFLHVSGFILAVGPSVYLLHYFLSSFILLQKRLVSAYLLVKSAFDCFEILYFTYIAFLVAANSSACFCSLRTFDSFPVIFILFFCSALLLFIHLHRIVRSSFIIFSFF